MAKDKIRYVFVGTLWMPALFVAWFFDVTRWLQILDTALFVVWVAISIREIRKEKNTNGKNYTDASDVDSV